MKLLISLLLAVQVTAVGCATSSPGRREPARAQSRGVEVVILQINDVYEIEGTSGGKLGGLARVATVKKELLERNPNTMMVLAGDFLSPSALGTAPVDGKRLAGKQMVGALNAIPLDLAVFGNHEFDITRAELLERMSEARFTWIAGNVRETDGSPYGRFPESHVRTFQNERGEQVRVGFIGLTIDSNPKDHVRYLNPFESARQQIAGLEGRADVIVALTHLDLATDIRLASEFPQIDLVMGGHEHENILVRRGSRVVPVAKADANAKSVFVHVLKFDPTTRTASVDSAFRKIDDSIPEDPATATVVRDWVEKAYTAFRAAGFEPTRVVGKTAEPLDGLEASVRTRPTNLTDLIARSLLAQIKDAELAFFNGGSIRIDDIIPPGPVTEYDVIRILPFGGKVFGASISGQALKAVLNQGKKKKGNGMFLQHANITESSGEWLVNGAPIESQRIYRIATNDYMVGVLKNELVAGSLAEGVDVRRALIEILRSKQGLRE